MYAYYIATKLFFKSTHATGSSINVKMVFRRWKVKQKNK